VSEALVIIVRDITRIRQLEDYLVKYGAKKNTLLDNLAHHISGALSLMQHLSIEATKLLRSDVEINVRTYLNLMEANCLHCIDIINDLMRHEHLESTDIEVKKTKVDVVQIVSIIHQELLQSYSARKIILQSASPSIQIMADNVKLLQVVNNLASNALKFTDPEGLIFISIQESEHEVIISVADQGIGIPDSLKPFIFQKQPGGGRIGLNGERSIGIGLSLCKNLVDLMGGRIWFESEEGKGSTFYISLPKD
jgi:two-component system sensor histidine kinase VicK